MSDVSDVDVSEDDMSEDDMNVQVRPQPNIPSAELSDDEARAHVAAVCPLLAELEPGTPGMTSSSWQELATLVGPARAAGTLSMCEWLDVFSTYAKKRAKENNAENVTAEPDPRLKQRPYSPDIRWLGTVVEHWGEHGYTNDYTKRSIHPKATDLRLPGHRSRFGEKALRFGGIDFALCALECGGSSNGLPDGTCRPLPHVGAS